MLIWEPQIITLEKIKTTWNIDMQCWYFAWYYFLIESTAIFVFKDKESLNCKIKWEEKNIFSKLSITVQWNNDGKYDLFSFFFDEKDSVFFLKIYEWKMFCYRTWENIYIHKK